MLYMFGYFSIDFSRSICSIRLVFRDIKFDIWGWSMLVFDPFEKLVLVTLLFSLILGFYWYLI